MHDTSQNNSVAIISDTNIFSIKMENARGILDEFR
jgi:hypothetical protein